MVPGRSLKWVVLSWPGFRGHHVIGYYSGIPYDPDSVA
jgi:hypothetical protein